MGRRFPENVGYLNLRHNRKLFQTCVMTHPFPSSSRRSSSTTSERLKADWDGRSLALPIFAWLIEYPPYLRCVCACHLSLHFAFPYIVHIISYHIGCSSPAVGSQWRSQICVKIRLYVVCMHVKIQGVSSPDPLFPFVFHGRSG